MSKKGPDPEPDYTAERAAYGQSTLADRQNQANKYNAAINQYNTGLADLNSKAGSLGDQIRGLSIVDDEQFGTMQSNLRALENQFNATQGGLGEYSSAPDWASTVNSPYGAVDVGKPSLTKKNTQLANGFSSQIGELKSVLTGLQDQRTAEERRIDEALSGFGSSLSGLGNTVGDLGIGDQGGITTSKAELARLQSALQNFNSPIADEYRVDTRTGYGSQLEGYMAQLADVESRRAQEQTRIDEYRAGLNSTFDQLNSGFGGLTIADESGIEALQRQIDAQQLNAGRFSSELNPSFAKTLGLYDDLESRLGGLRSDRMAEQQRIEQAQQQASQGVNNILSQLGSTDIYNGGGLNSLDLAIQQGRNDMSGFSSVLDFDFSQPTAQLQDAEAQLANLRAQRAQSLSQYDTDANALEQQLLGYDLSNETGLRQGLTKAQQMMAEMMRYTGTDVSPYRQQVQETLDIGQNRLNELGAERGNIENAARQLLTGARSREFSSMDALDQLAQELAGISTRQTNYGAVQAQDEIDAITSLISGERNRIRTDEEAALARQQEEAAAFQNQWGSPMGGYGSAMAAFAPWMSAQQRRAASQLPSSFARQLQVMYA
jgi:hypothetical protein